MSLPLYSCILVLSVTISYILMPFVFSLSIKLGATDAPDPRKIHAEATPRLGGVAIFCAMLLSIILFCQINQTVIWFLVGAIIIFLTGLIDDLCNLSPRQKLACQIIAAGIPVLMGNICAKDIGDPFGLGNIKLGLLAAPFTIFWIVGVINAINLLDGLDGLAGGVCAFACISFAVISFSTGNITLLCLSIALLGALLSFLRFNIFPSSIFMGDCGSLFLGYCMGTFSVLLVTGGNQVISPYIPLLLLAVPVIDTLIVMTNRWRSGNTPFLPDKTHLHHRLLNTGISHKTTVIIIIGISYILDFLAITGKVPNDTIRLILLATTAIILYGVLNLLFSRQYSSFFDFPSITDLRASFDRRKQVKTSRYLLLIVKVLLVFIILIPLLLDYDDISAIPIKLLLLMSTMLLLFCYSKWNGTSTLMQSTLCVTALFVVLINSHLAKDDFCLGISLSKLSDILFMLLLIILIFKVIIRNRSHYLISSRLDYLIILIMLTIPLLPPTLTNYNSLITVATKSVALFVAIKLLIMRHRIQKKRELLNVTYSYIPKPPVEK